jgi:type VI secretion system protein
MAAALGLALSCGVASATRSMFSGSLPMTVVIDPQANENSAIAVDLVVVYDAKVTDQLMKLRAADWFTQKKQFIRDHPNQVALLHAWEWVPGQPVGKVTVSYGAGARKIFVYADYGTDGDHRATVDPQQEFTLTLGKLDLDVEVAR